MRKNRGAAGATSLVLLVLVGGIFGTWRQAELRGQALIQLGREEGKTKLALAELRVKKEAADAASNAEIEANQQAMEGLRTTTDDGLRTFISQQSKLDDRQREYLGKVRELYRNIAAYRGDSASGRWLAIEGEFRVARLSEYLGELTLAVGGYETAVRKFEDLGGDAKGNQQVLGDWASAHNNLGLQYRIQGKLQPAIDQFLKAITVRERAMALRPDDLPGRIDLGKHHLNCGLALMDSDRVREAEERFRKASEALVRFRTEGPAEGRSTLSLVFNGNGLVLVRANRPREAAEEFRRAIEIQRQLVDRYGSDAQYRRYLAQSHNNLGILCRNQGDIEGSISSTEISLAIYRKLSGDFPAVIDFAVDLGGAECNFGNLSNSLGKAEEFLLRFQGAIETLEGAAVSEPGNTTAKLFLRNSHGSRAQAFAALGRFEPSARDWDAVVELSQESERFEMRFYRAGAWVRAGKLEVGIGEIDEPNSAEGLAAVKLYEFARVYSLASGKAKENGVAYADKAMSSLNRAVRSGLRDTTRMKTGADLDPIRNRADYLELLKSITEIPR